MKVWMLILVVSWDQSGVSPSIEVYPTDTEKACERDWRNLAYTLKDVAKVEARCYGPVNLEPMYQQYSASLE